MNNIYFREFTAPLSCRGLTISDGNGDYTVFVNRDLSDEAKERTKQHELEHIRRGDLQKNALARIIELYMKDNK